MGMLAVASEGMVTWVAPAVVREVAVAATSAVTKVDSAVC